MLAKLVINVVSTAVLLLHLRAIEYVAGVAARVELASGDHRRLRVQLAVDASLALLVLLVATGLSIFKPRGVTRYGWHKQREERAAT